MGYLLWSHIKTRDFESIFYGTGSRRLSVGAMVSLSTLRTESGSRLSNKTIPIINPMVKAPNWPSKSFEDNMEARVNIDFIP